MQNRVWDDYRYNDQFLRRWHEVDQGKCSYHSKSRDDAAQSGKKWFPYNKGGEFRKWYGNQEYLVNWENDGYAIRAFGEDGGRARSVLQNTEFYFLPSVTWSFVSSSYLESGIPMLAPSSMLEVRLRFHPSATISGSRDFSAQSKSTSS